MKIFLFVIIVLTSTPWINAYDGKPENFRSGVCGLKRIAGPCREYFPRYYFNKDTQECRPFIYGGCRGNGNNFEKRGECENICVNTNITEICGKDDDCLNGGKCIAYGKYRFCECLLGTEGVFCSEVTTCKTNPSFCGTGNETICSYDSAQRRAVCQCLNSSRKYDNKEKICRDPCQDGECENGGKCTGNGNFKYCECLRGTTGSLCSEITDCNKADFCGITTIPFVNMTLKATMLYANVSILGKNLTTSRWSAKSHAKRISAKMVACAS
ncbi:neurogenic locus notch homolog protein 1-like isoform X1 [Stegodyphus dumicola]|uniref:neurogenic locus notch homolog protein 1-like isoform X1 n=1 Tax=Stegodyphus dumicola TaxID=202533 RepID=UPI0015AC83CE|nr:neurogenic locus notch homolog protein 1-like isoform X1 [Stegodyphus dumicola]